MQFNETKRDGAILAVFNVRFHWPISNAGMQTASRKAISLSLMASLAHNREPVIPTLTLNIYDGSFSRVPAYLQPHIKTEQTIVHPRWNKVPSRLSHCTKRDE